MGNIEERLRREMKNLKTPAVSVIVPTYRRQDRLPLLIERLSHVQHADTIEVIVIDQSPSSLPIFDDTIVAKFVRLLAIQLPIPNVSAARNIGGKYATSDLLLFLDDDMELGTDFISTLLAIFREEEKELIACGPAVVPGATRRLGTSTQWIPNFLPTGALAIRTKSFFSVGGFDENLYQRFEDAEFSHRLKLRGHTLITDTRLMSKHHDSMQDGTWYSPCLRVAAASLLDNTLYFKRRIGLPLITLILQSAIEIGREALFGRRLRQGNPLTRWIAFLVALPRAIRHTRKKPGTISSA